MAATPSEKVVLQHFDSEAFGYLHFGRGASRYVLGIKAALIVYFFRCKLYYSLLALPHSVAEGYTKFGQCELIIHPIEFISRLDLLLESLARSHS